MNCCFSHGIDIIENHMKNVVLSYCLFGCKHNSFKTERWHIYITPETNPPRLYWITTAFIRTDPSLSVCARVCLCIEPTAGSNDMMSNRYISQLRCLSPSHTHAHVASRLPSSDWFVASVLTLNRRVLEAPVNNTKNSPLWCNIIKHVPFYHII